MAENRIHYHPAYEWYYHDLVKEAIENNYLSVEDIALDKEFIAEQLDSFINQYLEYDKEYSQKYVYEAWKGSYFYVFFSLKSYLTIYGALISDEELLKYKFILDWKDPDLKLHYIVMLWKRNLEVDQTIVMDLIKNVEGSQHMHRMIYQHKREWLPTDPSYQKYYVMEAAGFIFFNQSGIERFPDEVEIMGSFEVQHHIYHESHTYYVVRVRSNDPSFIDKGWMRMLVGGYVTSYLPNSYTAEIAQDHYTDFKPWESKSFEEHVEDFRTFIKDKHGEDETEEIFYSHYPMYKKRNNTIAFFGFLAAFGLTWVNDWFVIGIVLAPVWLLLRYLHDKKLEKNILVRIRRFHLDYKFFEDFTYVLLSDIEEVKFEKRAVTIRERFLFLPIKKWHYTLYDCNGNIIYSIPKHYLLDEFFLPILKDRTEHLANPPVFEWEKENEEELEAS